MFHASPVNLVFPLNYDGFRHKILFLIRFSKCCPPLIEINRNYGDITFNSCTMASSMLCFWLIDQPVPRVMGQTTVRS
jgi:hypothetical protein